MLLKCDICVYFLKQKRGFKKKKKIYGMKNTFDEIQLDLDITNRY